MTLEEIKNTYINEIKEEPYKAIKRLSTVLGDNSEYKWYSSSEPVLMEDLELLLKYVNDREKCKPYIIRNVPYAISARGSAGYYELECDNCHNVFKSEYYEGDPYWTIPNWGNPHENTLYKIQEIKYKYCPYCGREIDWDNLQKRELEIYEAKDNE